MLVVLFLTIIFGLITSYTDIKERKIKNSIIILMLLFSLIVNLFITREIIEIPKNFFFNFLFSLIFSLTLWFFNLWTPGDAKLFFAYSILIPLSIYKFGIFDLFPSFVIIINTFVPVSIYILISSFKKIKLNIFFDEIKKQFTLKNIGESILNIAGILIGLNFLFSILNYKPSFLINSFFIFLIFYLVKNKKILNIFSFLLILIFSLLYPLNLVIEFMKNTIFMVIFFQFIMIFVTISKNHFIKKIRIKDLKPGMKLNKNIAKKGNYWIELGNNSNFNEKTKIISFLTEDDIKDIKNSHRRGKVKFEEVEVIMTLPFAPLLFLGVLLTLISQGNIFIHLITLKDFLITYIRYLFNI